MTGHKPLSSKVRFFMWGDITEDGDFVECSEREFLEAEGRIEYERHTVHENGVAQICLTKNPL